MPEVRACTPTDHCEREAFARGFGIIAGVDEAGRGPLAGPVAAAAVLWDPEFDWSPFRDSKQLSASCRASLALRLAEVPHGVGWASVEEIDQINILQATRLAMQRAIDQLPSPPDYLLVDGRWKGWPEPRGRALVGGDRISSTVAAASILAKVARDQVMEALDLEYPHWGFARHKGYPTADHLEALRKWGLTPVHRRSFAPVRALLEGGGYGVPAR